MEPLLDVRKVAYELLDSCKAFLQENGYLQPRGVVLEPTGKVTTVELDFSTKESKRCSMQMVGQLARGTMAVAVIMITDSTYRVFPPDGKELRVPIQDPDLAEAYRQDGKPKSCISMDMKVEGQTPTIVMVPYRKDMLGKIEFGETKEAPLDFTGPEPPLPGGDEGPID